MTKPIGFARGYREHARNLQRIERELESAIELVINDTTRRMLRCRKLARIAKQWRKRALVAESILLLKDD